MLARRGVADTVFTAKVGNRKARLVLFQDRDNLSFGKLATLHALVLKLCQNELQTGLNRGGKVRRDECEFCEAGKPFGKWTFNGAAGSN